MTKVRKGRIPGAGAVGGVAAVLILASCGGGGGGKASGSNSTATLLQAGLTAQASGDSAQAITDYNDVVAKDPSNKFAYYDLGVIYQQRNDIANATKEYRRALVIDPGYKPALYNLAIIETNTNPLGAIALYQQLLQLNANDVNVNFNLGLLLYDQGQHAQGDTYLNKAIKLDPALRSRVPATVKL